MAFRFVLIACVMMTTACTGSSSPTAPTPSATTKPLESAVATASMDVSGAAMDALLDRVFDYGAGAMAVVFPPRNEPLEFRNALEAKYRDGLRRGAVQTYVDGEGTIVWAIEYLRYRVSGCSHADAVSKVMSQIDGQGIAAECGSVTVATFPPRNEPLAFMQQLEAKYRDGLRRSAGSSFVDVEGNIVWTQEYLRYRVSTCGHASAQQKVFDQIDGRGVQADCTPIVVVAPPPPSVPSGCTSSNPPFSWDANVQRCRNRLGQFAQSVCCGR